jgi:hypothetical protein
MANGATLNVLAQGSANDVGDLLDAEFYSGLDPDFDFSGFQHRRGTNGPICPNVQVKNAEQMGTNGHIRPLVKITGGMLLTKWGTNGTSWETLGTHEFNCANTRG